MACTSCACGDNKHVVIPSRGPVAELEARGARRTCVGDSTTMRLAVPQNWNLVPTSVSHFHQHLVDGEGNAIACVFTKPGSGGSGSFQMSSKENCAELAK